MEGKENDKKHIIIANKKMLIPMDEIEYLELKDIPIQKLTENNHKSSKSEEETKEEIIVRKYFYLKNEDKFIYIAKTKMFGSCFIDNTINQKSDIMIFHETDPLFLLLHILPHDMYKKACFYDEQLATYYVEIGSAFIPQRAKQILAESKVLQNRLYSISTCTYIGEPINKTAFKIDTTKLLEVLTKKYNALYEHMLEEVKEEEKGIEHYKEYFEKTACGLICDQLPFFYANQFLMHILNMPLTELLKFGEMKIDNGKHKLERDQEADEKLKPAKKAKVEKEIKIAKNPLTSYFTAKPKNEKK